MGRKQRPRDPTVGLLRLVLASYRAAYIPPPKLVYQADEYEVDYDEVVTDISHGFVYPSV
jgi:hypothetical protein